MFENSYNNFNPFNNGQNNYGFGLMPKANGNYFYVNGVEGAKAFLITQPNTTAILFDSDSNEFFVKSTNIQGQATLKRFEYSEKSLNEVKPQLNSNVSLEDYVSRQEFEDFKSKFNALKTTTQTQLAKPNNATQTINKGVTKND